MRTISVHIPNRVGAYECTLTHNGCWEWPNVFANSGYGRLKLHGKASVAHRYVYELKVGKIPDGMQIDHLCRNRRCVNPDHLEPVSPFENQRRGNTFTKTKSAQTHCINGHSLSGTNLFIRKNGCRRCRCCERERQKRYRSTPEFKAKHAAYERMRRNSRKDLK